MMYRKQWQVARKTRSIGFGYPITLVVLALGLLTQVSAARAQISVATGNGIGAPGDTASVTMTMTGSSGNVAQLNFDIVFDVDVLSINTTDCTIAPRLAATHSLSPFIPQPGRLRLGVLDLTFPLDTFGDGDLATCTFHISGDAQLGTTTPLTMENLEVSDDSAPPAVLPSTPVDGEIEIAIVTPTNTPTNTPVTPPTNTPTATPTNTPVTPPTNTATATATRTPTTPVPPTNTATATATRTNTPIVPTPTSTGVPVVGGGGGGCSIAASDRTAASPLGWLIVPAALLFWRRRSKR
jgi:Cohesin domain